MSNDTAKAYLQEMLDKRGYLLDYHKVLVVEDLPFMKGVNELLAAVYTNERSLSKKVKELLFSVLMTAVGVPKNVIKIHIELAAKAGASKEEVLEALELVSLPCGLPKFFPALEAWTEVFEVEPLELDS